MLAALDGSAFRRRDCRTQWPEDVNSAHAIGMELGRRLAEDG
jgi:hypothetical protein